MFKEVEGSLCKPLLSAYKSDHWWAKKAYSFGNRMTSYVTSSYTIRTDGEISSGDDTPLILLFGRLEGGRGVAWARSRE